MPCHSCNAWVPIPHPVVRLIENEPTELLYCENCQLIEEIIRLHALHTGAKNRRVRDLVHKYLVELVQALRDEPAGVKASPPNKKKRRARQKSKAVLEKKSSRASAEPVEDEARGNTSPPKDN